MKRVTTANKLAELLGIQDKVDTTKYEDDPKKRKKLQSKLAKYQPVPEEEIQKFRAAQGIIYFLQAPELFSAKICKHCGESFLVSRQQVAYCSYTCIKKELEKLGIKWSREGQYEVLANDDSVYEGNEPIWIKNIEVIRKLLDSISVPL